jgi:hypothetical protein
MLLPSKEVSSLSGNYVFQRLHFWPSGSIKVGLALNFHCLWEMHNGV